MTTAGFRFIPIDRQVVEPPIAFGDLDLARPLPDGSVSGSLKITWTAESPVCIGDGEEPVSPIQIGGEYALPGASLRGMVRAVVEIATFSHLGDINSARHYGVRDYDFNRMPEAHKHRPVRPRQQPNLEPERFLRAGWLKYEHKKWILRTCEVLRRHYDEGFWLLHFSQLLGEMARQGHVPPTEDQWRRLILAEKHRELIGTYDVAGHEVTGGPQTRAFLLGQSCKTLSGPFLSIRFGHIEAQQTQPVGGARQVNPVVEQ
jgi:hypothetical protein